MPDVIDTTAREADDSAVRAVLEREPDNVPGPDVVDEAEAARRADAAVVARAEATNLPALPEPAPERATVPAVNELQTMAQLATTFAHAGLVPSDLQGRPADCLLVIMTARDLGISITDGFRLLYPIDGRVTVAPKLKLAIIRQRGLAKMWPDPANNAEQATWHAERDGIRYSQTFTMDDAKRAELAGKKNWRMYPQQMLSWRALGYLIDVCCPEVGTGLYSADELGAITDDDGNVIDVTEVQPVVDPGRGAGAGAGGQTAGDLPADPSDLWTIQLRVHALPEAQQLEWRKRKMESVGKGVPTTALTAQQLRGARAVLNGLESAAHRADKDWTAEQAAEAVRLQVGATVLAWLQWVACGGPDGAATAPTDAAAGPEPEPAPDTPHEVPSAAPEAARPTVEDVGKITEHVEAWVKTLSVQEVRDELDEAKQPTTGAAATVRKRLIGHLVQKELRQRQETTR